MQDLGSVVSMGTGPGDVLLLGGDLGAGKTCFSRGFVQARIGDFHQKVTSPTYLLDNTYPAQDIVYVYCNVIVLYMMYVLTLYFCVFDTL